ncbi:MAG: hypothetical protein KKB25_02945, partial [Nanoarchaeota archaeon]|nr:hypothetical protein [Nanoarchaeota archaeon]
ESAAKKRILVIGDSELNNVLYSINGGLKNYRLIGLPSVPYKRDLIEKELSGDNHYGVLVDELYVRDFLSKVEKGRKKYGIIRWHERYGCGLEKIMNKNKTVKFGCELPTNIEKELDAIFS